MATIKELETQVDTPNKKPSRIKIIFDTLKMFLMLK